MTISFCSLVSGSSGNCYLISDGNEKLLIDVGLSGKQIQNRLKEFDVDPKSLTGILVSHEHGDHTCGVGVMSRRFDIPIYANRGTWQGMEKKIGEIKEDNRRVFHTDQLFNIGDFIINPYTISHDANEPVGFSFGNNGVKISIATDLGFMNEGIIKNLENSDLVVLESNHDEEMVKIGPYPYSLKRRILSDVGHLSNENAGKSIVKLVDRNVKGVMLAHLSKENNFPELAVTTVEGVLKKNNIHPNKDVNIDIAHRDRVSKLY